MMPALQTQYKKKWSIGRVIMYSCLAAFSVFCLIPLVVVLSASLSEEQALATLGYSLLPHDFTWLAYEYVFKQPETILRAYGVTIFVTVVGTIASVIVNALLAYPLSRKYFKLKGPLTFYVFFTMLFSGGLVPYYIVISQIFHLRDTLAVLIVPMLVTPFYILLMRTFFSQLPEEVMESAKLEGAGEYRLFFQLVLPLSTPVLATVGLFYSLSFWNEYMMALLFIDNLNLRPLQLLLFNLISSVESMKMLPMTTGAQLPALTIRMATAIVAIGPIVFVYVFFQKYFVRGLTVGALKG
ncbi:carbohydrate ABC transporter permease [Paenibacillus sp. GCM10023252]|uniref:carbohydrate ABC transporter permease n=1 Tax=Paenibacillus sp. GCM10023252 TaxID=3252649 RepID=UPI0036161404